MNLFLSYFPKELVDGLQHKNNSTLFEPVLEIPDFKDNVSALYSLISEFFLFVTREKCKKDIYLSNYIYTVDIPINTTAWFKKYPDLDLKKFDWFAFWDNYNAIDCKTNRTLLIKALADNELITIKEETKSCYSIEFSVYPQFEGLRQIQFSIMTFLKETGLSLYSVSNNGDILSPLPTYFIEKGLVKVGYNVYNLRYTFTGEILLNDRFLISKLNYSSANGSFFEYVFQHPKQKISKEQLEHAINVLDRPISKLVYDIGFSGELKKLFFPKVSNNAVYFNNPVTQDDLLTLKIEEKLLLEQLQGLKTIHSNTV